MYELGGGGTIQPIWRVKIKITLAQEDCDHSFYNRIEARVKSELNSSERKGWRILRDGARGS